MSQWWLQYGLAGGILFSWVVGSLLHFTYRWSGQKRWVGYFSATSESIWEHTKLSAIPFVVISVGIIFTREIEVNNLPIALAGAMISAIIVTATIFYTYTTIIGTCYLLIDITIFAIACIVGNILYYELLMSPQYSVGMQIGGGVLAVGIIGCFSRWTYYPPNLPYFNRVRYKRKV